MFGIARKIWARQETLEKRLFWIVLAIDTFVSFASIILTAVERVSDLATIFCAVICTMCILTGLLVYKTAHTSIGYFFLIGFFSCVATPVMFFLCGGINSAMPFFLLTGPFMCSFVSNRFFKFFGAAFTLLVGLAVIVVSWMFPEWVTVPPGESVVYLDISVNYLLFGAALFGTCSYAVQAYMNECHQKDELLKKIEDQSRRDDLTGLYNRRYFVQYLEDVVWQNRDGFYVVMFDIDAFRQVNATYGRIFGDSVICAVSRQIGLGVCGDIGERAIRFSGETFACILKADSEIEAFSKADQIREMVANLQWEEFPMLHVTVSGGVIPCVTGDSYDKRTIVRMVDDLLFAVKRKGVNQVKIFTGLSFS